MRLRDKWEDDSNQYRRYNLKQKINSVILGLAIGDALGVPVEFRDRDTYHISDMVGYGTYNQPAGTWSDDTSLSLALIEHLLSLIHIVLHGKKVEMAVRAAATMIKIRCLCIKRLLFCDYYSINKLKLEWKSKKSFTFF